MTLKNLENTVVHLPTKEECKEYLELVGKAGWRWSSGDDAADRNPWNRYDSDTCIDAHDKMGFCYKEWLEERGFKIITLKEFKIMQNIEKTLDNLKVGDILVDKYGEKRAVLDLSQNGQIVFLSFSSNHEKYGDAYTVAELKKYDYTIYTPEDEQVKKAIELLEKKGKLVDGKILN
jgi:hypothetical protein